MHGLVTGKVMFYRLKYCVNIGREMLIQSGRDQ